jgi:hypothetical protein
LTAKQTLGALHLVPVPVTFYANVYLTYHLSTCLIEEVFADATISTQLAGLFLDPNTMLTFIAWVKAAAGIAEIVV